MGTWRAGAPGPQWVCLCDRWGQLHLASLQLSYHRRLGAGSLGAGVTLPCHHWKELRSSAGNSGVASSS